jgi:hypothetical protein
MKATTRIKQCIEMKVDGIDLRQMLVARYPGLIDVEDDVRMFFRVPGGADWSNTDIDIDGQYPIQVVVTKPEEVK